MIIQHNIMALNAHRQLSGNTSQVSKNIEKLSSGFKINRAGDDASGLAISEKMRAQIKGLEVAQQNAQDGISLIQTAEGALTEVHSMLNRMVELAEKSANGTVQDKVDRDAIQKEVDDLLNEIDRIAQSTNFNGINLLSGEAPKTLTADFVDGTGDDTTGTAATIDYDLTGLDLSKGAKVSINGEEFTGDSGAALATAITDANIGWEATFDAGSNTLTLESDALGVDQTSLGDATFTYADTADKPDFNLTLQIGDSNDSFQKVTVEIDNLSSGGLGIKGLNVKTQEAAGDSIQSIKDAINKVSTNRANLGGLQNRLEHTVNNLAVTEENMTASESRIRDVDMAKEMMSFTKNNVLTQAAQAMLAQANTQPQSVLQLLQ